MNVTNERLDVEERKKHTLNYLDIVDCGERENMQ